MALAINPPELKDSRSIGYNHALIAEGEFYMAGQVAMDSESTIIGEDIETQARKVYENIGYLLESINQDYEDITKVTTHIIDAYEQYFNGYKTIYFEYFEEPYPCHTVLGAHQLAHEGYLLEVEIDLALTEEDVQAISVDGETVRRV